MVEDNGFTVTNGAGDLLPVRDAIDLIESSQLAEKRIPILRLLRPAGVGNGPPMCFEFFGGSQSKPMRIISEIWNKGKSIHEEREEYRKKVSTLLGLFSARGTTDVKRLMKVSPHTPKERNVDDCLASLITFVGWEKLKEHLNITQSETLLEMDAAVGTTHALITAVVLGEQASGNNPLKRPLIVRVGAPAFGLGNEALGLNYIMNTQPDMRGKYGWFTCGDLGTIMSEGGEKFIQPQVTLFGNGNPSYQTIFFLNGGWPLFKMLQEHYSLRGKPIHGIFSVVRTSRVGGRDDWGALFTLPERLIDIKTKLSK